jgi:hypothetical protein
MLSETESCCVTLMITDTPGAGYPLIGRKEGENGPSAARKKRGLPEDVLDSGRLEGRAEPVAKPE